ncbi:hypothetical protein QN277_005265 [Acacia crassicarpa]|uniref:Uncharacterized protein n=1 Tax=Acacia crassicarpa TaxID=499986 RepID=A0AAE1MG76_9FABA|nr:hypothetical protein QN277_005265 [Acacia crassicarpa]
MGRTGKKKQSLMMKLILSPMRILKRARKLYMKGLEDCAGEIGPGGFGTFPISQYHHHQSFLDVKPLRARFVGGGDITIEQQQIPRKAHIITNMNINGDAKNRTRQLNQPHVKYRGKIRKMARIDEDRPSNFEEDQIDIKITTTHMMLDPRRSYFY